MTLDELSREQWTLANHGTPGRARWRIMKGKASLPVASVSGDPNSADDNQARANLIVQAPAMLRILLNPDAVAQKGWEQIVQPLLDSLATL